MSKTPAFLLELAEDMDKIGAVFRRADDVRDIAQEYAALKELYDQVERWATAYDYEPVEEAIENVRKILLITNGDE